MNYRITKKSGWMDYCQTRERERIKRDIKKEQIQDYCYYQRERNGLLLLERENKKKIFIELLNK